MLRRIFDYLFRCKHKKITLPRSLAQGGAVTVQCLDCGRRLPYSMVEMRIMPEPGVPKPDAERIDGPINAISIL